MTNPNNPQLQRAAPELLAMLKQAVDVLARLGRSQTPTPYADLCALELHMKDVIAKAEGREP